MEKETPVKKDQLLDGIADIVHDEQNVKQGKMYSSILSKFISFWNIFHFETNSNTTYRVDL